MLDLSSHAIMSFLTDSVKVEPIRVEDACGGRRATLQARLGKARLTVQMDIGIGDAVTPAPEWMEYPGLLDLPRARLRVYSREGAMDPERLADAIAATFARRKTAVPDGIPSGLSEEFASDAIGQAQWKAFLTRNRLEGPAFKEVVREVREFTAEPMRIARKRYLPG